MEPPAQPLALETLLAHRDWVRRVARALAHDEATADDIEQTAWVAAIESPPRTTDAPRAWLATVLRRAAARVRRGESRRSRREAFVAEPEATQSVADRVAEAESHERVVRAVVGLPEPYRGTVVLRWFDGVAPAEIAARMGVSPDTVQTRLRRAKQMLRAALDDGERDRWRAAILPLLSSGGARTTATATSAAGGGLLMGFIVSKTAAAAAVAVAGLVIWSLVSGGPRKPVADVVSQVPAAKAPPGTAPSRAAARASRPADATSDAVAAAASDAPAGVPLRIRVRRGDVACAGARVIVCRGGKVLASTTADAAGVASASAAPGAADVVVCADGAPIVRVAAAIPGDADVAIAAGAGVAGIVRVDGAAPRDPLRMHLHCDGKFTDDASIPAAAWDDLEGTGWALDEIVTQTDAAGRFRFDGIAAGVVTSLAADGYVLAAGPHALDDVRAPREDVVLDLVRLPALRGRVVDAAGGRPLAGATLTVTFDEEGDGQGSSTFPVDADAHGRFEIPYPEPASKLLALAVSAADGRGERDVGLPKEVPVQWDLGDLPIAATRAVSFVVQDESGRPLAGAVAISPGREKPASGPSDEQGAGRLELSAGSTTFRVAALGYEPVDATPSADPATPARVVLHRAAQLCLTIDSGGAPVLGMTVRLRSDEGMFGGEGKALDDALVAAGAPPTAGTSCGPRGCTSADFAIAAGTTTIEGLRPDVAIRVALFDSIGTVAARGETRLVAGTTTELRLAPPLAPRPLRGVVRGPDGAPVAGAQVMAGEDPPPAGALSRDGVEGTVWTDAEGRFAFDAVCAAHVRVYVHARGLVPVGLHGVAPEAGVVGVGLSRGRTVLVTVTDAEGARVSGAAVFAHCPGFSDWKGFLASVDGEERGDGVYAIAGLPDAAVDVLAARGDDEARASVAAKDAEATVALKPGRATATPVPVRDR